MTIKSKEFAVQKGANVDLKSWPTEIESVYKSKKDYLQQLEEHVAQLKLQQEMLYASNRFALLLIFQAMDTAGKDGAISHVMSGVNPQGCQVFSFKQPSATELQHDFLWRTTRALPERGRIGIFNRSYYEEVLITRVHPEILANEGIAIAPEDGETIWQNRYQSINNLERHLHLNGTRVIKFFLHISKDEQRKRLLKRTEEPEKYWKFNLADVEERKFWNQYMDAYEKCIHATSTEHTPWHIIPADDKKTARLIISQTILDTMLELKLSYPKMDAKRQAELKVMREKLS